MRISDWSSDVCSSDLRFDLVLPYEMPDAEAIRQALELRLIGFSVGRLAWQKITVFAAGLSTADVVAAAKDASRRAVLADHRVTATGDRIRSVDRCVGTACVRPGWSGWGTVHTEKRRRN